MSYNPKAKELVGKLNAMEKILSKTAWVKGDFPTSVDVEAFEYLQPNFKDISPLTYPHTFAWYSQMYRMNEKKRASLPKITFDWGDKAEKKAEKKDDDDMDDLFGDDDDDAEAAKEAAKKAKEAAAGKKKKKEVIAMSLVMLEVKPLDDTIDLDQLA